MMIDRTGALKPGPAGHRRCRGGCGLDRAGPADPLFHHRNERQRVAVAFQINELREKAYSPRDRKERTQGSPRSLDQRRNSEKKLSQHLTETPSCEGPLVLLPAELRSGPTGSAFHSRLNPKHRALAGRG